VPSAPIPGPFGILEQITVYCLFDRVRCCLFRDLDMFDDRGVPCPFISALCFPNIALCLQVPMLSPLPLSQTIDSVVSMDQNEHSHSW
jgi:hypothetical protein